ncbi:MAG: Fur family transcriptional regulator [Pirellulales bacterium]|jgi:Fur family transcriptional regulator, ferric uptake regulator
MPEPYSLRTVEVRLPPVARFEEFLRSRDKRITQQRRLIVEQVFSHHDHFDADELMGHLRETPAGRQVSRPTVYRTLAELVEAGMLRKMALGSRALYEHDYGYPQHDHLYCQQCRQLIEFHSDDLERIGNEVAEEHRFRVLGHRLIITGICEACARAEKAAGKKRR